MYGGFLYRMDYEDYKKREHEIDEQIKRLSLESDDEDIVPIDEAYIIRIDECEVDYEISARGYFVLLVGEHHHDVDYIEKVLYGDDMSYLRYRELLNKEIKAMTSEEIQEEGTLREKFLPLSNEDLPGILEEIVAGESDCGEVIKQIF